MITIFKSTLSFFTIFFLFGNGLYAQESAPDENFTPRNITAASQPKSSDTLFVNGTGDDFDKLLRREEVPNGRATYKVTIDRFYSQKMVFDSDGFLINKQTMISFGLIPKTATLTLRVFDVDDEGRPPHFADEIDYIFVNGNQVMVAPDSTRPISLTSGNQKWSTFPVEIPIEFLKFPQTLGSETTKPSAENIIQIDIDQLQQRWQVLCDWISIEIKSPIRPVLMIHGLFGNAETWSTFKNFFNNDGIPNLVPPSGFMDNVGSLSSNSFDINQEVVHTKTKFGVDQVNIVTHSKGGLDCRYYVRVYNTNDIEKLIQIATPNNGSEKADKVYWGAVITQFSMPAAEQLTTWWVRDNLNFKVTMNNNKKVYEPVFTENNKDKAPIYTLAGIRYPDENFGMPPPHDNLVPVISTTLPWKAQPPYTDSSNIYPNLPRINDGEFPFEHSEMHEKAVVYLAVKNILNSSGGNRNLRINNNNINIPTNYAENIISDSLQNVLSVINPIAPNSQNIIPFNIPTTSQVRFLALNQTGGYSFSLVDPSGNEMDSTSSNYSSSNDVFGKFTEYRISNPEIGTWKLITKTQNESEFVINEISLFTKKRLSIFIDSSSYFLNQQFQIIAELTDDNQPIIGADVNIEILKHDGTLDSLTLFDNGTHGDITSNDGRYTNNYLGCNVPGAIEIKATALKSNNMIVKKAHAFIVPHSANFNGTYNESIIDSDADELIDTLVVTVGVNVLTAGNYMVSANLKNSQDSVFTSSTYTSLVSIPLNTGSNNIKLSFIGSEIYKNGFDGPYLLSNVILTDLQNNLQVDFSEQPFTTQAYSISQFERPLLSLAGNNSEITFLDNGGKISFLQINFDVKILKPGEYEYNAELTDTNGNYIKWTGETVTISSSQVGVNTLPLYYSGTDINKKRLNGPYLVKNLSINSNNPDFPDANLYSKNLYTTSNFNFADFTGQLIVANVINTVTSAPIRNARLYLNEKSGSPFDIYYAYDSTNINGQSYFGGTDPGDYELYAIKNSDTSATKSFSTFFLDSTSVTINMTIANTLPVFTNLPDSILMSYNEISTLNLWDFVSDNESPDSTLYFDFSSEPDLLNLNFENTTGVLSISSVDSTFTGDVILTIRADDTFGGVVESSILIKLTGITGIDENQNAIPKSYILFQNYPNPFNPASNIKFGIPKASNVEIIIYNVLGQQVMRLVNKKFKAGFHTVSFNAASVSGGLSSGVYFYRIAATNGSSSFIQSKKMILLK